MRSQWTPAEPRVLAVLADGFSHVAGHLNLSSISLRLACGRQQPPGRLEPAVAPDRGGITVFRGSSSHQPPPRVSCYVSQL